MFKKFRVKSVIFNFIMGILLSFLIGSSVYYFASEALFKTLEDSLVEIAKQGAETVERDIQGQLSVIETIAGMEDIKDPNTAWNKKQQILQEEVKRKGFRTMSISDAAGNTRTNDGKTLYSGNEEFFKKALTGQKNVSEPFIGGVRDYLVTVYAVPIYYSETIVGVLYAAYNAEELNQVTEDIGFGKDGTSFIINKNGSIITDEAKRHLFSLHNEPEKVVRNQEIEPLMELYQQTLQNEKHVGEYDFNGTRKCAAFAPINGTQWYLAVTAPKNQLFGDMKHILIFITFIALVGLLAFGVMVIQVRYLRRNLSKEQTKSRIAINTGNLLLIELSPDGRIQKMNTIAQCKIHYGDDEIIGIKTLLDLVPQDSTAKAMELLDCVKAGKSINGFELPIKTQDNSTVYVLWYTHRVKDMFGDSYSIEIIGMDITERVEYEKRLLAAHEELTALYQEISASEEELKQQFDEVVYNQEQLRMSEERHSFVIEATGMGIWDFDLITGKEYFSTTLYDMFAVNPDSTEFVTDEWFRKIHPDDAEEAYNRIRMHLNDKTESYESEYRIVTGNGEYRWIKAIGKALWDADGNPVRMAGSYTDITEKKEYENKIHRLAYYDALTDLPNRVQLEETVDLFVGQAKSRAALFFIDIDNFKYVNDTFGHPFGDSLIIEVSKRILSITNGSNMVARLGGDELTVFLTDITEVEQVKQYAEDLLKILNINCCTQGITLNLSASVGIAMFPEDGVTFEELLKNADTAMYKAKGDGKRSYSFFDRSMNTVIYERMKMESNIRKALENQEFVLYYQPQFDLVTGRMYGFEALIRWQSSEYGYLSPLKFIPLAEETGLIVPIGKWVLKTACAFIKELHASENSNLNISVNVSVIQLLQDDFEETILNILDETGLEPGYLELEITETIFMECIESNLKKIERLRKHGINVALDDFGTGYSSLTYLKQLPISTLKIEKAFVHNIVKNKVDKDITGTIIMLAHSLGIKVIAECVETKEQLECLMQYKCDMIQGNLASKPLSQLEARSILDMVFA